MTRLRSYAAFVWVLPAGKFGAQFDAGHVEIFAVKGGVWWRAGGAENKKIAGKRPEYKAEARFLTLKKERRPAVRSAFVSGSARCWAFAREMPRCGVDAALNCYSFTPINDLQFLKC